MKTIIRLSLLVIFALTQFQPSSSLLFRRRPLFPPGFGICSKPYLRQLLGARCDPYVTGNTNCVVGNYSPWQRISSSTPSHSRCPSGQQPTYYTRTRKIVVHPRGRGTPCPPLNDSKTDCRNLERVLNNIGGFGPQGGRTTSHGGPGGHFNSTVQRVGRALRALFWPPPPCPDDRDIAIIIDESGSVGHSNFKKTLNSLGELISHMCGFQDSTIHCKSTRIAVIEYSTTARVVFDFNYSAAKHHSRLNVMNDIAHKPVYSGGLTATGDAIQLASDHVFQTQHGMRLYSKKSVLLLTDGHSNRGKNPVQAAKSLHAKLSYSGFNIIAMGIGHNINYQNLKDITVHSNQYNPLVYALNSYQDFETTVNEILQLLKGGTGTCTASGGSILLDKKRK
eukprot:m.307615 g.307615  ORF g.307615 m.307615 type:complete len:393 (+) comp42532_c0_seq1:394-1572(+)